MDNIKEFKDNLSFKDIGSNVGLRGHVKIEVEDKDTHERSLWYENDNIIPISGMQWVLMKMFGLHLDSVHDSTSAYENKGQDTSTVIPDLNEATQLNIGRDPEGDASTGYTPMQEDISAEHFIQGFMVGNGGSGEDAISTKNTDYCYIKLRNPIPFQQTADKLNSELDGKYLGLYRQPSNVNDKKYYIKKFDERAHIYHNWWKDGQKWDYIDPITQSDLGPGASSTPKTNRIETYAEVAMSIDTENQDCLGYFTNNGNNQSAVINELGLVAFDVVPGTRSSVEKLYDTHIKKFLSLVFGAPAETTEEYDTEVISIAAEIDAVLEETTRPLGQSNIDAFTDVVQSIAESSPGSVAYSSMRTELCKSENIAVEPMYNQSYEFVYETDSFKTYLSDPVFEDMTVDEAQRIKLVTYYTFKSIPLQSNWKIIISYRIYGN